MGISKNCNYDSGGSGKACGTSKRVRRLHNTNSMPMALSVGYETWPPFCWHHSFLFGWSKYKPGVPSAPLHDELMWPVGIPSVFQTSCLPLYTSLTCLPLRMCKGTVKKSTREWNITDQDIFLYKYRLKRKKKIKVVRRYFIKLNFFLLRSVVRSVFCKSARCPWLIEHVLCIINKGNTS